MKGGVRFYLAGAAALLALAGCGRSLLQYGERASWRHQAEVECLKSGAVKIGAGVVQIQPIEGPGMCGADFPLKVTALGETTALSYADEPRPPGAIPHASSAQMPQWPVNDRRYVPPQSVQPVQPVQGQQMRWVPGPPAIAPARQAPVDEPQSTVRPVGRPISLNPPGVAPYNDDIPDDAILPPGRAAPRTQPAYNAPVDRAPPLSQPRALPSLGPMRGPRTTATIQPATVSPPATLACPLVSALDRWVSEGVQPAALRWFGAQVTEIKQISAYSCRSMVGAGTSHISEHAFGNALDIAGFTLADGRKITVKDGWRGSPEEQGFLHDVQLFACETFSTVLAPGYNAAHYDHIHVDLMRRDERAASVPAGCDPGRGGGRQGARDLCQQAAGRPIPARCARAARQRPPFRARTAMLPMPAITTTPATTRRLPCRSPTQPQPAMQLFAPKNSSPCRISARLNSARITKRRSQRCERAEGTNRMLPTSVAGVA